MISKKEAKKLLNMNIPGKLTEMQIKYLIKEWEKIGFVISNKDFNKELF